MPDMLNPTLSRADFYKLDKSQQAGFKKYRIETFPAGTQLFKLTTGTAAANSSGGVTPWWAVVKPFKEDRDGVLGRWQRAKGQGVDLAQMTRVMGAVCIDWNDLDNYVQIELLQETKAFWGTHAPMAKWSAPEWTANAWKGWEGGIHGFQARQALEKKVSRGTAVPDVLDGGEAWQLFIPNLKEGHVKREGVIPGHDMAALGMAFGVVSVI